MSHQNRVSKKKREFRDTLRSNMTPAERVLWSKISQKKLGVNFYPQAILYGYICDFWAPRCKLVIEIDGPSHVVRGAYDRQRDLILAKRGIITIRFTNKEVFENIDVVLNRIYSYLGKRSIRKVV